MSLLLGLNVSGGFSLHRGLRLGGREVGPLEGRVSGPSDTRRVHPKAMEVLLCLAERQGQVVRRGEIVDRVWGHRHGSDKALTRCIRELRVALADDSRKDRLIETIPKRGYRLIPAVDAAKPEEAKIDTDEKPSIAVLPFRNMSGNPEQEYFSDGITEDIITDLSRISGLFVIARNSTFTFKDKSATAAEVSHVASWRRLRCLIRAVRLPTRGWPSLTPSST